eukprot:6468881-Amphidinium_carterae.1
MSFHSRLSSLVRGKGCARLEAPPPPESTPSSRLHHQGSDGDHQGRDERQPSRQQDCACKHVTKKDKSRR